MPHLDPAQPQLGHRAPSERGVTPKEEPGIFGTSLPQIKVPRFDFLRDLPGGDALASFAESFVEGTQVRAAEVSVPGLLTALGIATAGKTVPFAARTTGAFPFKPVRASVIAGGTALTVAPLTASLLSDDAPAPTEAGIPPGAEEAPGAPTSIPLTPQQQSLVDRANVLFREGRADEALALMRTGEFGGVETEAGAIDAGDIQIIERDTAFGPVTGFAVVGVDPKTGLATEKFLGQPVNVFREQAELARTQALTEQTRQETELARLRFQADQAVEQVAQDPAGGFTALLQAVGGLQGLQQFLLFEQSPAGQVFTQSLGRRPLSQLLAQAFGLETGQLTEAPGFPSAAPTDAAVSPVEAEQTGAINALLAGIGQRNPQATFEAVAGGGGELSPEIAAALAAGQAGTTLPAPSAQAMQPFFGEPTGEITGLGILPEVAARFANLPDVPETVQVGPGRFDAVAPDLVQQLAQIFGQQTTGLIPSIPIEELQTAGAPRASATAGLRPKAREQFNLLQFLRGQ